MLVGEGMTQNEPDTDDGPIELHTSAPAVEMANDAARRARCKECNHMRVVYLSAPGIPMRYACKEHGYKLCVDICDEACPHYNADGTLYISGV